MKLSTTMLTGAAALSKLKTLHPIVIEGGTGRRDGRDPDEVARRVCAALRPRLPDGDAILVTQGDPLTPTGISAVTRRIAAELGIPRGLVTLDASIDADHATYADRENVILELKYSALAAYAPLDAIDAAVDAALAEKNRARETPLAAYYKDYALLQEVTKASLKQVCGDLLLAHTSADVPASSVTSFYEVGLALDLYARADLVPYR